MTEASPVSDHFTSKAPVAHAPLPSSENLLLPQPTDEQFRARSSSTDISNRSEGLQNGLESPRSALADESHGSEKAGATEEGANAEKKLSPDPASDRSEAEALAAGRPADSVPPVDAVVDDELSEEAPSDDSEGELDALEGSTPRSTGQPPCCQLSHRCVCRFESS